MTELAITQSPTSSISEAVWADLLDFIQEGKLVPVLGPDLLRVAVDGVTLPLYTWLARRLVQVHGIALADLPPEFSLNDVVTLCKYSVNPGHPCCLLLSVKSNLCA